MRYLLFVLVALLSFSCSNSKEIATSIQNIPKPTHIQPDTCLTDKQLRQYYNFVKDSLKIELKRDKQIQKKEIDSLKIELKMLKSDNSVVKYITRFDTKRFNDSITKIRQMYSDSLKVAKVEIREETKAKRNEEKTRRVEVRQENKTERAKLNRLTLFIIGFVLGIILPRIIRFATKIV